jgi:tRNA (guanine10-N2)-methyltransferase
VFFMPASPETYREDQLPTHPMLALVSNVEQPLQSRYSRRLVTMVKVRLPAVWSAADIHDTLYEYDRCQQFM